MTSTELREYLSETKGKQAVIVTQINELNNKLDETKRNIRRYEQAREIVKAVAKMTQEQLVYVISEITTMALDAVLENPYDLILEFVERRDKTECDIFFERDGNRIVPTEGGGGPIDVAAFALRVAAWSMQRPHNRDILILDEPFKHLKGEEANRRMLEMVLSVCEKLGIQVIMVSDERVARATTVELTDKLFETKITRGITKLDT